MNRLLRRFHSNSSINKSATKKLLSYKWAELETLAYLNLIDYRKKIKPPKRLPWENIPCTEKEIRAYCQSKILTEYSFNIVDEIPFTDISAIHDLIIKVAKVLDILRSIWYTSERLYFYYELIYGLLLKRFYDPASFLLLWNSLFGDSDKAKIGFLRFFLEKESIDIKSYDLFSYSLSIARVARFNFWGMWFKQSDEDNVNFCPITFALLSGAKIYLVLLLKYGFEQNSGRLAIYDAYYYHVENTVYTWLKAPLEDKNPGRNAIVTEILLFLILISKINSPKQIKRLVKCFHYLWNMNAIPFVTKSELVNEIYHRFQSPPRESHFDFPHTCQQFIDLVEYYNQVKPLECTEDIQPRTLKQVCKCAIRRMLVRSYNLPNGITKLPLPKILQEFLGVKSMKK